MRIAVLDDYQQVALRSADWSPLAAAQIDVYDDHLADRDALVQRLAGADVIIAMRERTPFDAEVIERLPKLRLLVTTGLANAAIDLDAARRCGVIVCGTRSLGTSAAELTWALLLALARAVPREDAGVRAGGWQQTVGVDLAGATLGLLGLGRLGQRVARYARAFDMTVLAWSQNLTAELAEQHGARLVTKQQLFTESQIVSIHLKLSPRTTALVGAAELEWLGPRGYLINTSRGPIVDEAALVAALRAGTIAGAGLDVFDVEPLPADHPLRGLPNTVLTPHLGYVTEATYALFYADAVADILAWQAGRPVRQLS